MDNIESIFGLPIADDLTHALRRASKEAGAGRVKWEHIEQAINNPATEALPPTVLHLDPSCFKESFHRVLSRARELAVARNAEAITVTDVREAMLERRIKELGLDLERLRHYRGYIRHRHACNLALRMGSLERADDDSEREEIIT